MSIIKVNKQPRVAPGTPQVSAIPTARTQIRVKVIPVGPARAKAKPRLQLLVHGPANSGKTHLISTIPGAAAGIVTEPATTFPVLKMLGLDGLPICVARTYKEFVDGIPEPSPYAHSGVAAFLKTLPAAIDWLFLDTMSTLLTTQHALHLEEQEEINRRKVEEAKKLGHKLPGLDKFAVYDFDLQRARRVQQIIEAADRHVLWLAHTNPYDDENLANPKKSVTAGRPLIQGQFRTFLEAWIPSILYIRPGEERVVDSTGKGYMIPSPKIVLTRGQVPFVKHKWNLAGDFAPDLGALLEKVGEWPR